MIYVDFYASTDTQITASDYYLGQVNFGASVNTLMIVTLNGTLPTGIPPGTYYVGWIIDPGNVNDETDETNNTAFNDSSMLTVVGVPGSVIYVDVDARGNDDGSSWQDAYRFLHDALARATARCEIRVAAGVYTPDRGAGVTRGDRQATFRLKDGVTLAGGYAGAGEPNPNARDIESRLTILSGDLNGDDRPVADPGTLWIEPSRLDNSRHVVTAIDAGPTTVLDGVYIVGGCADGWFEAPTTPRESQGAGVYIAGGGPRLRECMLLGNWASIAGGAIYSTGGSPELLNCTLCGNAAGLASEENRGAGGAVCVTAGSLTLTSCSLNGNFSSGSGGALVAGPGVSLSAANCVLHANHAVVQAGAVYTFDSEAVLASCTMAGNQQDAISSAVVCETSSPEKACATTIVNSILWDDGSEIASLGAATVTVTYSDIRGGRFGVGNIDADPWFADPSGPDGLAGTEDDGLRLDRDSPCVDAGDTASLPADATDLDGDGDLREPLPLDRDGNERVNGDTVDMGAYEARPDEG